MGEFDDVLAMEPGDDWASWDEWAAGQGAAAPVDLAPLAAELRLPNARVHLRGAVPAEALDTFADLADPALEVGDEAPLVTLTLDELDDGVSIVDLERGEVGRGADVVELIGSLAAVLTEVADRTDPMRVHLAAACVELDGAPDGPFGVVFVEHDPAARHGLVARLLPGGARFLGADRTILLPGSRTVFAEPMPLDLPSGWARASTWGSARPYTVVGAVVLVERRAGATASIEQLGTAEGCARLLERSAALDGWGSAALDAVASLAAGATFWHLVHDDLDVAARLILDVQPRPHREVVTFSRLDHPATQPDPDPEQVSGAERRSDAVRRGRAARRMARFTDGNVLVDGSSGQVDVIDDAAADELQRQQQATGGAALPVANGAVSEAVEADLPGRAERVLAQVVDLLEEVDCEPVLLGELVQAHDGTGTFTATPLERIDLLVDRSAIGQLTDELEASGFELVPHRIGLTEGSSSLEWRALGDGSSDGPTVGLHWQLAVGPFGELVDHEELSRRSVPCAVGSRWYRALHPEDRFVLACVRAGSVDRPTPEQLRAVVLTAPYDEMLMASALEASERWGATRTVLAAVRAADAALPGMPAWLVARARPGATGAGAEGTPRRRRRLGSVRRRGT
jgi:hypothetical protein